MNNVGLLTYNAGGGVEDYARRCKFLDSTFEITSQSQQRELEEKYNAAQVNEAKILCQKKADVYCLQEIFDKTRPLIKELQSQNYQLFHLETVKRPDCLIALNMNRFQDVVNHSLDLGSSDVAIVLATEKQSGQRMAFVSAHLTGFNLDTPNDHEGASIGNNECRMIANKLNAISSDIQIVGADMNADPNKWPDRFTPLTQSAQFKIFGSGAPTNVYPNSKDYTKRSLDYFLYRDNKTNSSTSVDFKIKKNQPLTFETNASDHLPISAKISMTPSAPSEPSFFSRLWSSKG